MKRAMLVMILTGLLLACYRSAPAEVVGQQLSQTEAFRQYESTNITLQKKIFILDEDIKKEQTSLSGNNIDFWYALYARIIPFRIYVYPIVFFSLLMMTLYCVYLVKWHPLKWRLLTSGKTFGRLRDKILHRNGLMGLLLLIGFFLPVPAQAKTNVLQDIKMYYTGNAFEKGYLLCKYSKGPINLGYTAVQGVPVIEHPALGFEREFDVVAHLLGLGKTVGTDEYVSLYELGKNDFQRQNVVSLLARADREQAQDATLQIVEAICTERGVALAASIASFKGLLAAFADSNNRLLVNVMVKDFLEKSVGRVKNLEDLDNLVDLSVANNAFEIIRDATAKVVKTIPSRLSFADTVYAARVSFRVDKDMARGYFNAIRFNFSEFVRSEALAAKIVGLIRDLSSVAAFLPLYETDALYKSLQQQPNDLRVAVTGLFDRADSALAAVAYNSIGNDSKDIVFSNSRTLIAYAGLTDKYKQDKIPDFLSALRRAVVELDVPYRKGELLEAVAAVHQSQPDFIESVLTYDMSTDCRFNRNNSLILSLIEDLPPEQLKVFDRYFNKKTALAKGILTILFAKEKSSFYDLLRHVFAEDPKNLSQVRFPNDILDFQPVAPAFSGKSLEAYATLPASIFVAQHELAGTNPDIKLVRRALIPMLDVLFRNFLTDDEKRLSEEQVLSALVILSLLDKPTAAQFSDEVFVLDKLVTDYFSGAIKGDHNGLREVLASKEKTLAGLGEEMATVRSAAIFILILKVYAVALALYLLFGGVLSFLYACNSIVPGKNFSLLNGLLNFIETHSTFAMATLVLFPVGFAEVISTQFLRGLIARDTVTPDIQAAVALLENGYGREPEQPPRESQQETPDASKI